MNNKNNTETSMEMPKKKEEFTDIKEVSTKQENKKDKNIKKIIMTIIIIIIIILLLSPNLRTVSVPQETNTSSASWP